MQIHEYQGKKILNKFKINIPIGYPCSSISKSIKIAKKIKGNTWVIKSQILAGGRGKAGGIKIAKSLKEVFFFTKQLLNKKLITNQTNNLGKKIKKVLIEEFYKIKKEYYLSIINNYIKNKIILIFSKMGGVNIEKISLKKPDLIYKININPEIGILNKNIKYIINKLSIPFNIINIFINQIKNIYQSYWMTDSLLLEINPLVLIKNKIVSLDIKYIFDSNSLIRQKKILNYIYKNNNRLENKILKHEMSYISLNGNIGCLINGAGLAMATMDIIKLFKGNPANFLDIGGKANKKNIYKSFKIILNNKKIKIIFINIFGGIIHCDNVIKALIYTLKKINFYLPLIIRIKGTNEKKAKKLLNKSKLFILIFSNLEKAVKKSIQLSNL